MATSTRSQIIMPGDTVRLRVLFKGPDGQATDLDAYPAISIFQPDGGVVLGPTSTGVFREAVGTYGFDYSVGLMPAIGVWADLWQGSLNGFTVTNEFEFIVETTDIPSINSDGYVALGDDPGYSYSQVAIQNINMLLKLLSTRLNSKGKHKDTDAFGNTVYTDCDIFTVDQLTSFLVLALEEFNETPTLTLFSFDDSPIIQQFGGILVKGATVIGLASQALIERGREFALNDNGIGFTPPSISEILETQYAAELQNWYERVKLIKFDLKPSPRGLGTLRPLAAAPQFLRLRHLRERQII